MANSASLISNQTMITVKFRKEGSPFSVVVEDDGRVAYAYLLREDHIVGDVWLYNRVKAPVEPEWNDRSKMPFANPQGFVRKENSTDRRYE